MDTNDLIQALSRLKRAMPRNEDVLTIDREVSALLLSLSKMEPKKERVDRKQYMREYMRSYRLKPRA